jgi:DNA-binding HxlR family transcriptional regulator
MARTYSDRCGIARALDVVGERWALLVVRELLLGPKRFTDLRAGLPNVGPDMLTARLKELEAAGVVRRATLAPPAASKVYELTERGAELEPVILALGRWGSVAPVADAEAELGVDAFVIALKTLFRPDGDDARVELRLGDQRFAARVEKRRFEVARGTDANAEAVIAAEPGTLARALWHGGSLKDVQISGDGDAARRFLTQFLQPLTPAPSSPAP